MKHRVVIVTGGFDPLHSGHLEYLKCAKALGEVLIVGLNSDDWLSRKKGKSFLPYYEREQVLLNLKSVDNVINFADHDDTAIEAILKVKRFYPNAKLIFANGGDRTDENIPELEHFMDEEWIDFEFNVGGSKSNSSSNILEKWADNRTERDWGYYRVLHNDKDVVKVKELVVAPGKSLSMQKHKYRAEHWFIASGLATVYTIKNSSTDYELHGHYKMFDNLHIKRGDWHMLSNETNESLRIVEIQYGSECIEDDIERKMTIKPAI